MCRIGAGAVEEAACGGGLGRHVEVDTMRAGMATPRVNFECTFNRYDPLLLLIAHRPAPPRARSLRIMHHMGKDCVIVAASDSFRVRRPQP